MLDRACRAWRFPPLPSGALAPCLPAWAVPLTLCLRDAVLCRGVPQIGFVSNAPVSDLCLAAGCGANQCLRTSVKCSGSGFPVFSCESAESTVDMQPLPTCFHTGLAIVSLVILFARRPVDLSNARIAGILLIVWAGCVWCVAWAGRCAGHGPTGDQAGRAGV